MAVEPQDELTVDPDQVRVNKTGQPYCKRNDEDYKDAGRCTLYRYKEGGNLSNKAKPIKEKDLPAAMLWVASILDVRPPWAPGAIGHSVPNSTALWLLNRVRKNDANHNAFFRAFLSKLVPAVKDKVQVEPVGPVEKVPKLEEDTFKSDLLSIVGSEPQLECGAS